MLRFLASVICIFYVTSAAPIPLEIVDMTHVFDNVTTLNWPGMRKFGMTVTHNKTSDEGYWLQTEEFFSGTHVGTHMDAPCHFAKGGWCIEQIPLDHLIAPVAVIDITERAEEDPDATVDIRDLENWEKITGQSLDSTIVMIRSGWASRWKDWESFTGTDSDNTKEFQFPGMSEKAAQWLADKRKVYGVGSETLSLDNGASSRDLMAHRLLLGSNIYGLENVDNVDLLPIYGATLHVMPMKIKNASGAPVRIFATFPKVQFSGDKKCDEDKSLREVIIFGKNRK